ncbi:MAG: glutathione S-transferase N-terminal domain-containing protein [Gammaproteobacteria bacterium]|nr:glutathione S-transferase N-terminal domain-containing protein [Gammaproteobacteria bacterium]
MIDLYFWTTPNGYKPLLFLEEADVPYEIYPVNISAGEQFEPVFTRISPNNKIPAIYDRDRDVALFESGAILLYLADKFGQLIAQNDRDRARVLQWLFWQVGGVGPTFGQNLHFGEYAAEHIPYAVDRFVNETHRLFKVLDVALAKRDWIGGSAYSIADMAIYPWVVKHPVLQVRLSDFPRVAEWFARIEARPATVRAYGIGAAINTTPTVTAESRAVLLNQGASTVAGGGS